MRIGVIFQCFKALAKEIAECEPKKRNERIGSRLGRNVDPVSQKSNIMVNRVTRNFPAFLAIVCFFLFAKMMPSRREKSTRGRLNPNTNQHKLTFLVRKGYFKTIKKSKKPVFQKSQSEPNHLVTAEYLATSNALLSEASGYAVTEEMLLQSETDNITVTRKG